MLQITAATRNQAKIQELGRLLEGVADVHPLSHDISPEIVDVDDLEVGESCIEIAQAKAIAWSQVHLGDEIVIATDGGLVIPHFGQAWNPTRTRRFVGGSASDFDRATRLLELTAGLSGPEREIGWIEAVAIAQRGQILATWSAESEPGLLRGEVDAEALEASGGFWIDSLWLYPRFGNRLKRELLPEQFQGRRDHWSKLQEPIRAWLVQFDSRRCQFLRSLS